MVVTASPVESVTALFDRLHLFVCFGQSVQIAVHALFIVRRMLEQSLKRLKAMDS